VQNIELIIFDLGNVLLPFDMRKSCRNLAKYSALNSEEIFSRFWEPPRLLDNFEKGKITGKQFYSVIKKVLVLKKLDYLSFSKIFNGVFAVNEALIKLVKSIKDRYRLAILSNTNAIHWDYLCRKYSFISYFDYLCPSHKISTKKPDLNAYKYVLDTSGTKPSDCLFVDDLLINIRAARQIGINSLHYKNVPLLKNKFKKLGILK